MGAASSVTTVTRKEKRDNIRVRNTLVRDVENFVLAVFSCFPRGECMQLILKSETGFRAFSQFVESEHADDYLLLFLECGKIKEGKRPTMYVLRKYVEGVLHDYVADGALNKIMMSRKLVDELKGVTTTAIEAQEDPVMYMMDLITKIELEMVNLMAKDQLARFLSSRYYKNWRANERGRAIAATAESAEAAVQQYSKRIVQRDEGRKDNRSCRSIVPEDMTAAAFKNVKAQELDPLLRSQSWLSALVAVSEILPVSFALSRVASSRKTTFPLIFVNSKFEQLTGYKRNRVLGKNCKSFLQCTDTEHNKIAEMSSALKNKESITIKVTNVTETGRKFQNIVALKPVMGHRGDYAYVLALHMEFDPREGSDEDRVIKQMAQLVGMLPSQIVEDQIEQPQPSLLQSIMNFNSIVPGGGSARKQQVKSKENGRREEQPSQRSLRRRGEPSDNSRSMRNRTETMTMQEIMEKKKRLADEAALAAVAAADEAFASQKAAFNATRVSTGTESEEAASNDDASVDSDCNTLKQESADSDICTDEGAVRQGVVTASSDR